MALRKKPRVDLCEGCTHELVLYGIFCTTLKDLYHQFLSFSLEEQWSITGHILLLNSLHKNIHDVQNSLHKTEL